ncbi:MAG: PfkB family carbohydrate kinase [Cyanophyceae cyanobacterium]
MGRGLFVGAIALDLIYLVESFPNSNQKIVALQQAVSAGGPATNAAVTYGYLGNRAKLVGVIGSHPVSQLIHGDLKAHAVDILDLEPNRSESPPVSSIIVTQKSGDRAVIAINSTKRQAAVEQLPPEILQRVDVVLIDGHQLAISRAIAQQSSVPVVLDGGSWKEGLETVLPFIDYAICSANFYPPGCDTHQEVITCLKDAGITKIAITGGEAPIQYSDEGNSGTLTVPSIQAVDTLGAGDIFHGAFCYYIQQQEFVGALAAAAEVASASCQFFGTRQWMQQHDKKKDTQGKERR